MHIRNGNVKMKGCKVSRRFYPITDELYLHSSMDQWDVYSPLHLQIQKNWCISLEYSIYKTREPSSLALQNET
jgi:hypothetical protein